MLLKPLILALLGIPAIASLTVLALSIAFPRVQASNSPYVPQTTVASTTPVSAPRSSAELFPKPKLHIVVPPKKIVHHKHKRKHHVIIPTPRPTHDSPVSATPTETPTITPTQTTPTETPTPTVTQTDSPTPSFSSSAASKAVAFAIRQIGCPYVYGGTGPCSSGFDCSGLVSAAWQYAGTSIPRTSYAQFASLRRVSLSALRAGDILVFYSGASHVALYAGNGRMIDASHTGVPVEEVSLAGYYASNLIGAVRP